MIMAILRLMGMAGIIAVAVLWIISLVRFNGECEGDCNECLFPDQCPDRKRKEEEK